MIYHSKKKKRSLQRKVTYKNMLRVYQLRGVARGQLNKTFTSVAIVLESEDNSYTCTLLLY